MIKQRLVPLLITLALSVVVLVACNMPTASTPESEDPDKLYTIAAQTVEAQMTQSAASQEQPNEQPSTQPPDPDDEQPSMYEEYQDLYGGDDPIESEAI